MEKDVTEKTLESYNDVFADIVNGLLFNGRLVVKEDELVDASPVSQYKIGSKIHEQERDVAKFWRNGTIRLCLYGFENQTKVDSKMPLRIISYDGAGYRGQLAKDGRMENQKHYPVVTLVLYFGMERWKNRNLHSCLEIPPDLKDYVSDYRINVFEIAWLSPKQVGHFKSDFKIVADYFVQKRTNKKYRPSRDTIKHVDEILKLMSVLTRDRRYEEVQRKYHDVQERGGECMCEVLEEWWQSGIKEGENRVAVEKALAVMDKLNLSKEEAVNVLSLTPVQVKLLDKELAARKKMR